MKYILTLSVLFFLSGHSFGQLVAHWRFNGNGNDETNTYNVTVNNSSMYIASTNKEGTHYLSFDGSDYYVNCGTIPFGNQFTITGWFMSYLQTGTYPLLSAGSNSNPNGFCLSIDYANRQLRFITGNGSSQTVATTSGVSWDIASWVHFAIVVNKTTNTCTLYVNGTNYTSSSIMYSGFITTNAFLLGRSSNGSQAWAYGDDFHIYNCALSQSDIASIMSTYNSVSCGTATAPTVTTQAASSIAQTTATSGGNVTSAGSASVTARGVCWSTSANPTISNSKTTDGTGTGTFTSSITGLTAGTTYHVRAYATNSVGTSYGSDLTFVTTINPVVPAVTTNPVSNITQTTATSGGNVTADGGASVTARGVCWSTSANPTTSNSKTTDGTGTGNFTSSITGLTAYTTYHIRAYATNSVGTAYGSDLTFTAIPPGSGSWQTSGSNIYYNSGKVSIGTTIANSASSLTVGGKILATEVEVVSSITADDVFELQYKLLPLPELETYLIQNKHLPGIPSAAEIAVKGQNLGKMDDLLLRKIEELTLYIINQQKEIEELKHQLEVLKSKDK